MELRPADPRLFSGPGQGSRHRIVRGVRTALISLEREIQGKSAGLRTQAIVGTSAALILLISTHSWTDVLNAGTVMVDPSRVATQIVSGIGFSGRRADHHPTRRDARPDNGGRCLGVRGDRHGHRRRTATPRSDGHDDAFQHRARLHPVGRSPPIPIGWPVRLHLTYIDSQGVMARILSTCDKHRWQLAGLAADRAQGGAESGLVGAVMTLSGGGILKAPAVLAQVDGVTGLRRLDEDAE